MLLKAVRDEIINAAIASGRDPKAIQLVAVTKGKSVQEILTLYDQGQRIFGESRVQEVEQKRAELPQDISWHLIGSLQLKKVPKVIGCFSLIHSVDSFELAQKLSKVSVLRNLSTDILLQVNTSKELSKHGFSVEGLKAVFSDLADLPGINLRGLMTMAPLTDDSSVIISCFNEAATLLQELQDEYKLPQFCQLSMGMSQDFKIAIQCGATLLRIGTRLFAE